MDGRLFGKRAPSILGSHGVKRAKFTAMVDRYEDPHDVYPVYIPARGRLDVALGSELGDLDVDLVSAKATRVGTKRWRLASSHTVGVRESERIRYTNRSSRPLKVYIDVFIPSSVHTLDSQYVLAAKVS